jgi:hypothetical protein
MTVSIDHGPFQVQALREAVAYFKGRIATPAEKGKWVADRVKELAAGYQAPTTKRRPQQRELRDFQKAAAGDRE